MLRRHVALFLVATASGLSMLCAITVGFAGSQEPVKKQTSPKEETKPEDKTKPEEVLVRRDAGKAAEIRRAAIDKLIAAYDLKPHPAPAIPDDPPPHEGAMISLPLLIEPPDLVIIEVLDALPGRPISGERLVRPDGKISLGFYGDVDVRGLTVEQLKVAIIKHLRKILIDEALGLEVNQAYVNPPEPAKETRNPFEDDDKSKVKARPSSSTRRPPLSSGIRGPKSVSRPNRVIRGGVHSIRSSVVRVSIPVQTRSQAQETAKVRTDDKDGPQAAALVPDKGPITKDEDGSAWIVVPPAESQTVFVDVTAYNSMYYYILGDVQITGRLPWTGNETVLDALQYAGGLLASAEPKDIRLVRPGRGNKPAKVYKVDLAAIQERGDVTTNYQIFPNDRLTVGRNEVVQKTVAMDRLAAPIHSATTSIHNTVNMLRAVQLVDQANSDEIMKALVDFWVHEAFGKGDLKFDEQTLRDALLQRLKSTPVPKK